MTSPVISVQDTQIIKVPQFVGIHVGASMIHHEFGGQDHFCLSIWSLRQNLSLQGQ